MVKTGRKGASVWYVYILRCKDKSLYTGITTDVSRRVNTHNAGRGAKAIRGRLPATSVHVERYSTKSLALKREAKIKQLSKTQKLCLIRDQVSAG